MKQTTYLLIVLGCVLFAAGISEFSPLLSLGTIPIMLSAVQKGELWELKEGSDTDGSV